jgi:hypothetical protein
MEELNPEAMAIKRLMRDVKAILVSAETHQPRCRERERLISVATHFLSCMPDQFDDEGEPILEPYKGFTEEYWDTAGYIRVLEEADYEDQSLETPRVPLV